MEKRVKTIVRLGCVVAAMALATVTAKANVIVNGGFEAGPTGPGATSWSTFGNVFTVTGGPAPAGPHSGTNDLQEFGTFPGSPNTGVSGAFQSFATTPGTPWSIAGFALNPSSDPMTTNNFGLLKISFQSAGNTELLGIDSVHITAGTVADVWQALGTNGIAPAGTTHVQMFALFVQPNGVGGGSTYFDDISASVIPEPSSIVLVLSGLLGLVAVARKRRG